MTKRRAKRRVDDSPVWSCHSCIEQFMGGVRCGTHNPTPEERDAHPERYHRGIYAKSVGSLKDNEQAAG